ncbi:MAG TPA: hypothetical protein DIC56_15935 [Rhizobium sp.]|nr:hypothetical protein [Rhizobium sp.]
MSEEVGGFVNPISLLVGEMPGRAEGGKPHTHTHVAPTVESGRSPSTSGRAAAPERRRLQRAAAGSIIRAS